MRVAEKLDWKGLTTDVNIFPFVYGEYSLTVQLKQLCWVTTVTSSLSSTVLD
jgi:hypothetical protein